MKPWLIVVLTVEAVLILALLVLLACLCGTSSTFTDNAVASASRGLRGAITPLNVVLYLIAAAILIPAQLIYLSYRKNRYED